MSDDLAAIEGLTEPMLVILGKKGIRTLDDLGDLASDDLIARENKPKGIPEGILRGQGLTEDDANRIIMAARAHWFADEAAA